MTSQAFRDAAYPQETATDTPVLLLIEHDDLAAPIRLTDAGGTWSDAADGYVLTALGETWLAAAFRIDLPAATDQTPKCRLVVPNVDQRLGEAFDRISTPATVTIRVVLGDEPDTVIAGPHTHLLLRDVRIVALTCEGTLERDDLAGRQWPRQWIRPGRYLAAMRSLGR